MQMRINMMPPAIPRFGTAATAHTAVQSPYTPAPIFVEWRNTGNTPQSIEDYIARQLAANPKLQALAAKTPVTYDHHARVIQFSTGKGADVSAFKGQLRLIPGVREPFPTADELVFDQDRLPVYQIRFKQPEGRTLGKNKLNPPDMTLKDPRRMAV